MPTLCAQPSDLGTPANCCIVPSCALEFQTKSASGGATLCGFSEFTDESSPPKKYRRKDFEGGGTFNLGGNNCLAPHTCQGVVDEWSGFIVYSSTTCASSGTGHRDRAGNGACTNLSQDFSTILGVYSDGALDLTTERLVRKLTGSGCRQFVGDPFPTLNWTSAAEIKEVLNQEDEEDDAIARANTTEPSWTPCTAGSPSDCSAFKALRGSGVFNMAYRTSQVRYQAGAGAVGVTYNTTITLARRVQGSSDPFVDFAELTHQHIGTGAPYEGPWLTIPCSSGYETAAVGCSIEIGT